MFLMKFKQSGENLLNSKVINMLIIFYRSVNYSKHTY